jgi:hypothetical protein
MYAFDHGEPPRFLGRPLQLSPTLLARPIPGRSLAVYP